MAGKTTTKRSTTKRKPSKSTAAAKRRTTATRRRSNPKKIKLFGLDAKATAIDMAAIAGGGMLSAYAEDAFDRFATPIIGNDALLNNGAKVAAAAAAVVGAAVLEKKFKGLPLRVASIAFAGGIARGLTDDFMDGAADAAEASATAQPAAGYGGYNDPLDLDADDPEYAVGGSAPNTDASHMLGFVKDDFSHMAGVTAQMQPEVLYN